MSCTLIVFLLIPWTGAVKCFIQAFIPPCQYFPDVKQIVLDAFLMQMLPALVMSFLVCNPAAFDGFHAARAPH